VLLRRIAVIAVLLTLTGAGFAAQVDVGGPRLWPAPDHTRVVFDLSARVEHTLFTLKDPERVVIDLRGARLDEALTKPERTGPLLSRVRAARRNAQDLRVVLDLKQSARPKSFMLRPNRKYGHRLVIDLYGRPTTASARARTRKVAVPLVAALRDLVIAIDPGHGGEDPGARGRAGTLEKDVVLGIARRLATLVKRERGMRPVLVRRGDYYVGLRRRMQIAREQGADLFVSIHADAFRDSRVRGSSVYILSRNGASSEAAKWVADRENAADLVGGVSLDDKDDLLASVLLDLSQTATLSASSEVGDRVLRELKTVGRTHKRRLQRAGFVVLKSPDIPSLLIETAFISNPKEERKLRSPKHQQALARAIMRGIGEYFARNAPPGTLLAVRRHVIERGDTLSKIAVRYRVPLDDLRRVNKLAGDQIRVGTVLQIPAVSNT
jgi:N-acetylmuramoyl-L-alanine amidase